MCGIVGYLGKNDCVENIKEGLLSVEYRGYDSAGISYIYDGEIQIQKRVGSVANLFDSITCPKDTHCGIGHTRWATHGKPSKENSHPHLDNSKSFAVVHNGIIENYQELKKFLIEKGYKFFSTTDTEVIPNLIHYYFNQDKQNNENKLLKAVKNACRELKGSYAIEILSIYNKDKMIVVRKDSPLVIGSGLGESYISSDIPAILSYTKDFYLLDDNEIVELSRDKIKFYDSELKEIQKPIKSIEWGAISAEKDGYEDFMLKEIYEQPRAIRETVGAKLDNGKIEMEGINFSKEYLESLNKIYIVACGTAMHAGLATKYVFEKFCKIPVEVDIASEFRYRDPLIDEKTLCIYISQSGETADTIAALKLARIKGAKTLAISNVIGSSITREADHSIYTHAGPEIAVASTKAYTSQVVLLIIVGMYFAEKLERIDVSILKNLKSDILKLPSQIEEILKSTNQIQEFAKKVYKEKDMFFLGRGTDYAVSLEGSLKLKEISYIHSESYAAGELKHGPIALIENGVTVIATMTNPDLVEKSISNVQEVVTRGAKVLAITSEDIKNDGLSEIIKLPKTNPLISPILSVIPMQLFAYYISKEKGLDVDKPRNLAKSVTVE